MNSVVLITSAVIGSVASSCYTVGLVAESGNDIPRLLHRLVFFTNLLLLDMWLVQSFWLVLISFEYVFLARRPLLFVDRSRHNLTLV